VAEGWRICGQVGNLSAIFTKRARNVDEGQEKERYITNIESARKEFHTGCTLQIHSFWEYVTCHPWPTEDIRAERKSNSISVGLVKGKSAEVCFIEISPSKVQ
jgi:hypothetical protein